jgi:cytochrome c biogenesis factor
VFLLNNLVLAAFTFTVLLGTLFPLVAEAAGASG